MKFPVDLLADVSQADLEQSAHNYMNNLLYSNPDSPEHLTLSDSTQVTIDIASVGFVPLYGSSGKQKILALFSPTDPFTAVALYLLDQWWAVDNIVKTADPARDGAVRVETVGERIVLYILNRVIYRAKEMSSEELPFLCHGEKDHAKILWNNGEAVGFYSTKPPGSFCNSFSTRSYQLPVMDSIFVRKCQRGKGFGLQMLEDFVLTFKEDCLGLRYPLTKSMYKVCEKYLRQYPEDVGLLWEVESIGRPNQRTNIASKIQAMNLSAVSKSLSFTEESLTEVTEKDVVMEAITTQITQAESMECTVEIVEEVTVLRAAKEAEVPVAARGRNSGSKRRKMGEKITVIRIEDIEAETPKEELVSAQLKTELHNVSELVQTEGMFSLAPEERGEHVDDVAPEEEAAIMSDKPASQDLEEDDVTSAPTTEEQQVEDDATHDLNITSHGSKIAVENVASEIEEAEEKCLKEDTAMLVVSEEVLGVHKEAETLDKVGEVTDEKSEETAGKTGRTVVKAIKTVQSEPPRRSTQRHSKPEKVVKEETAAQGGGRVLRGRTVMNTPTPKRKYTQHSQKVCQELQIEVDEVAEENEVYTTNVVEELAVADGEEPEEMTSKTENVVAVEDLREMQQLEGEQLKNEEETEKQQESGVEDTVVKGSSTEYPDTADTALTKEHEDEKVTDESDKEKGVEVEPSVILDKQDISDDEIEPPVVEKRALRGRCKVIPKPKPTKQSKIHHKEREHTGETDLGAGGPASDEKADEQATDKQMEEHHQVEQEETVDKTEEEISTKELTVVKEGTIPKAENATEDVIPSSGVNMEESKEVNEKKETEGEIETVSVMEADQEEEADDIIQEPDTVAAASTVIPDEVLDEAATAQDEKPLEKDIGCEIPKLQKATVILVDLKTTCHHLSVKEAEETPVDGEYAAPEKEQMELIAAEEKDVSSCVVEEQTPDPEMLALKELVGSNQQQEEENIGEGITENDDEAETGIIEVEGEIEAMAKDAITVTVPLEEKQSSVSKICADTEADIPVVDDVEDNLPPAEVDEAVCLEEEQAPVVEIRALRSGTKTVTATSRHKTTKSVEETGVEKEEAVKAATVEKTDKEITEEEIGEKVKSVCKNSKQHQKEQDGPKESSEEAEAEQEEKEEAGLRSAEQQPTKGDEEKAPEEDKIEVENQELVTVEVEKGVSEEGTMSMTEEEENIAGLTAAADNLGVQEGETDTPLPKPTTDSALLTLSEEEATPSAEEQQSEASQLSDLQRVTVVLVDLKKNHHDVQEAVKEGVPVEQAAAEAEEEEEVEKTVLEKVVVDIKEESAVQVRVLRRGMKSISVAQRCTKKGTHKQLQEEEGGEESAAEERAPEEEEEQQQMIDQEKGDRLEDKDATQQLQNIEPEMGIEKADTVAVEVVVIQQDAPEEGQAGNTEAGAGEDAYSPTGQHADEGKASNDVAEEAVITQDTEEGEQSTSTSEGAETVAGESAQETLLTEKDDEAKGISEEEEAPVIKTRVLRGGKKTVRATRISKTMKRQDDEHEEKAAGAKSTEVDEPAVETRFLRKGRRSAAATATRKSKRARTQCETKEEGQEETTPAEEVQAEEAKAVLEEAEEKGESGDEKIKERNEEEAAAQKEENTEPEVEMEKVEAVAEESLGEQETVEEKHSAVSETCADEQGEASVRGSAKETQNMDEGKVHVEEEPQTVKTRVLRSGGKAVKATRRSKTTQSQQEEKEQEGSLVEKIADKDELAVEPRVLRKGRSSAPATPRHISKRACTQCQPEEEGEEETTPAEETEGEEEETGQKSPEEKGEKAEEKGKSMEIEVKKKKDVEEEEGESAAGGEFAVGNAEQKNASIEEAAVLEKEDNSMAAVDETGTDTVDILSAEVEETNSAEEEESTVIEKSTAATEVGSGTAIAEEEELVEDAPVVAEDEVSSNTKTSHATPSRRSRRQKVQGVVETEEEENPEDEETQEEVHQLTDDSPENRELNAEEQAETGETSATGGEAGPPAENTAEDETKETAGEEPATEETESPEEEPSESKKDKIVDSSVVEGRSLRGRMKTIADKEEDKAEEIQLPKRRSIRRRPRVDYRENDEEDERGETETVTDKEEEDKVESNEAKCSASEPKELKLVGSSREGNLENNMGAIEGTSKKGDVLNLVLDTDEEVETAGTSQEDEEDEQNMSEEEVEPIVISRRVLRGRLVPSVIITPQSKSRQHSAKFQKAEESLCDEERSPNSAQKRSLRKRKSTEVTPTRKSKRLNRV